MCSLLRVWQNHALFQDIWWFPLIPATAGWKRKREAAWLTGLIHIIVYFIVPLYFGLASALQFYNNLVIRKTLSLINYIIMKDWCLFSMSINIYRHVKILTISRNETFFWLSNFLIHFISIMDIVKNLKINSVEYLVTGLIFYHVLI